MSFDYPSTTRHHESQYHHNSPGQRFRSAYGRTLFSGELYIEFELTQLDRN